MIDDIQVQRIKSTKSGLNSYKIIKPEGFEKKIFKHKYDDGYLPLLKQVIDYLTEKNYNPSNDRIKWETLYNYGRNKTNKSKKT